ncbi:nuclear pore complex protein Nup98-Nup96-like isoform X3 [Apostichopus japonicus]|uniref:nuclear pore complex protein Nup98-Nup96-like isoform X3 n=1 Tax=Stichopus japonicus TaxID=307972 RepID=UPI003AB48EAB
MFGQQNTQFGSSGFGANQTSAFSTPASGGFGTPSAFGAQTPSTNLFGNTANTNTSGGLFGNNNNNRFGQPNTSSGTGFSFGSNVFGTSNNNTATSTGGGGLFGTPASNSFGTGAFGAKPAAGFGTNTSGSLFGQQPSSSGSLFGQPTNTASTGIFGASVGGNLFGSSQSGTTIKFQAPNSQDTMVKNGTTQQVNTRHQVISAMKQYEGKSFEELRLEDYVANRKGGTGTGILGMGMTQQDSKSSGLFGQANTTSGFTFGTQSKPLFGGATTAGGFGTSGSLFGQTAQPQQQQSGGLFGAAKPAFGQTTQSSSLFGNTGTGTSLFGQNTQQKTLFGQPTTTPTTTPLFGGGTNTFGATTNTFGNSSFGQNTFGQPNQTGSLFNKPTGFGTSTGNTGLSFGTQSNSLFGNQSKPGGLTLGGGTSTGFGTTTDGGLFGNKGTTGFGTGLGTGSTFGSTLGSTFNTGNTGGSLFGNNKTTGFGSTFGNTGLNLGGGFGSTGLNTGGTNAQLGGNAPSQNAQSQLHLFNLLNSPYGDNPLFKNKLTEKDAKDGSNKSTSFAGQKPLNIPSHYKVSARQSPSAKPKPHFSNNKSWKAKFFEGLEEEDPTLSPATFVPRRSVKKLVIKKKLELEDNHVNDSSLFGKTLSTDDDLIERTSIYPERDSDRDHATDRQKPNQDGGSPRGNPTSSMNQTSPAGVLFSPIEPASSSKEDGDPNCTVSDLNPTGGSKPTKKSLESSAKVPLRLQESTSDLDQSSFVEVPDELENLPPPHPAGVVLHSQGYYCIPSLKELASITRDGHCEVENFTIGREGYGSVFFPGVTDISNLNLDEIVYFRRKEITVYPDDDSKPAEGEGLNKRAEVTLDRTWPVDKSSREPITDIERLNALGYEEKLERATTKLGAKFIEYRPETGSWVFEVPHFSKYSLQDDDEDDEVVPMEQGKKKQEGQKIIKKIPLQEKHLQPKVARDTYQKDAPSQRQADTDIQGGIRNGDAFARDDKQPRGLGGQSLPSCFLLGGQALQPPEGDEVMEAFEPDFQAQPNDKEYDGYDQQESPGYDAADDAAPLVPQQRLAETLGISTHRMQVMKASFFQEPQPIDKDPKFYGKAQSSFLGHQGYRPDSSVHSFSHSFQETSGYLNQHAGMMPAPLSLNRSLLTSKGYRGSPVDTGYDMDGRPFTKRRPPPSSGLFASPQTSGMLLSSFHLPNQRRMDTSMTEQPIKMVGARPIQKQVPLAKSLVNRKTNYLADFGCIRERTFRIGWSSGWNVTHSGQAVGQQLMKGMKHETVSFTLLPAKAPSRPSVDVAPYSVSLEKVHVSSHAQPGDRHAKALHINLLKVNLAHSLGAEEKGCPTFTLSRGVGAIHDYASMVHKDVEQKLSRDLVSLEHSRQVFDLLVALWGQMEDQEEEEEDISKSGYVGQKMRRIAFSKWLANAASEVVQREVQDSKFKDLGNIEAVFSLLTGHQIAEACEVAQQSGDHRLALLLAQAGSTREARQLVTAQLVDWRELEADQFIAPEYLKVYALLAGILVWPSSKGEINTCENLDWKRALALHLWHHCNPTASVADALAAYEDGFTGQSSSEFYCKRPAPPYMEKNESLFTDDSSQQIFDTCYHLLKLYGDRTYPLEKVLAPPCHSSHHLDYRISWHVMQSLEALGYSHLSEKHSSHLHTSYAAQLEAMGLWHWAIFVLLHITDVNRREASVKSMLERHASLVKSSENESIESFLTENLHVQPAWIHQAKALRALYENKPHDRACQLQQAGQWNDCHRVVMRDIAADCIINENYTYLRSYLDVLGMEENCCLIQDWNTNGQVYLDFIRIRERIAELEQGEPSIAELERLHPDIASLCQRVGSVKCNNAKDRLSVAEMSKRTANMMKIVLSLQGSEMKVVTGGKEPGPIQSHLLVPHINKLPLPEDYTLQELRQLARSCLVELTS